MVCVTFFFNRFWPIPTKFNRIEFNYCWLYFWYTMNYKEWPNLVAFCKDRNDGSLENGRYNYFIITRFWIGRALINPKVTQLFINEMQLRFVCGKNFCRSQQSFKVKTHLVTKISISIRVPRAHLFRLLV